MDTTNGRVKVEIKVPQNKTIEYNGVTIEINPYIDFAEQILLINEYVNDLFSESNEILVPKTKNHIFEAECRLKNYIIQINTNIDMSNIDNNIYIDDFLWAVLMREISNYSEFRKRLDYVVFEVREQIKLENSLGQVLSDILEKVQGFVEQIEKISPEDIKQLQEVGTGMISELEKTSILRNPNDLTALDTPLINEITKE